MKTRFASQNFRLWAGMSLVLLVLFGPGCGGARKLVELDGKVTFRGNPVPHGFVAFTPVSPQSSEDARVTCSIRDGQYAFTRGARIRSGEEYEVEVGGFPRAAESEDDRVEPLFPMWKTKVVIPDSSTTFDIEVTQ